MRSNPEVSSSSDQIQLLLAKRDCSFFSPVSGLAKHPKVIYIGGCNILPNFGNLHHESNETNDPAKLLPSWALRCAPALFGRTSRVQSSSQGEAHRSSSLTIPMKTFWFETHWGCNGLCWCFVCVCVYCIVSRQEQLIWNRDANSQSKSKKYGKTHSAASGLTLRANEFNCLWSKAPSQASPWNHPLLPGQILEPAVAIGECNSEGTRQGTSFSLQSCQSFSHANKTKTSIKFFILTSNC